MSLDLLLYCVVGFVEWLLAMLRTVACARGRSNAVMLLVFIETALGVAVLRYMVLGDSWLVMAAYAVGAAAGARVGARKRKS